MPGQRNNISIKRLQILIISLSVFSLLNGQMPNLHRAENNSLDSARAVRLYRQASSNFKNNNLEDALELAGESLYSAIRSNQEILEIAALRLTAEIYEKQELPGDAIPYYMRIANILETGQDTINLPRVYSRIAVNYHQEEVYEKEGEYYLKAFQMLNEGEQAERADIAEKIGLALMQAGLPDSSTGYLQSARSILLESGKDKLQLLNSLVLSHNQAGQYREALKYNEIIFQQMQAEKNYRQMATVKNNMGYNHSLLGEYEKALSSYIEAIDYGEKAGISGDEMGYMMCNAGISCQNMNSGDEAKPYFQRAIRSFQETESHDEKSRVENILALIYYHEGDLYNAGLFSRNSIKTAREADDARKLCDAYLTYSRILKDGNDPIQALDYYEKYLNIRDSLQLEDKIREEKLAQRRSQLEKSEKDLKIKLKEEQVKELAIQQLTLKLEKEEQEKELIRKEKDMQLLEQERLRQSLVISQQKYASEQQKRQNQILEQEKSITELKLEQEVRIKEQQEQEITVLEQQKQLDELELSRQKNAKKVLIGFIILGVLITFLIMISLISSRKKNILLGRQKKEIEEKNRDLENKNEEIGAQRDEIEAQRDLLLRQKDEIEQYNMEVMKSIEYARKIQSSTLPDLSSLNTSISEFFLVFRPRDIVSGDFFWTANVENSTVLTVSDCTGHGVPGAFMSMLGMSLLKEIVQKEYITHPGVVLRRLRKGIVTALGQKGFSGEQRDGMDMALITIDHAAGTLQYSGAYNPLYLVRRKNKPIPEIEGTILFDEEYDNDLLLYEIKADKMPIAHFVKMDKFSTHEFKILEGDNYYLFTDGYADQFGGPLGKKFKYKPFKRLLLQNAHLPMKDQKEILDDTLEKWMGNIAQVDDICIMGLRMDGIK